MVSHYKALCGYKIPGKAFLENNKNQPREQINNKSINHFGSNFGVSPAGLNA